MKRFRFVVGVLAGISAVLHFLLLIVLFVFSELSHPVDFLRRSFLPSSARNRAAAKGIRLSHTAPESG